MLLEVHMPLWVLSCLLDKFIKKNTSEWDDKATKAFMVLKSVITQPLILKLQDFSQPFVIECDARGRSIGVMLMHSDQPTAYMNKLLKVRSLL